MQTSDTANIPRISGKITVDDSQYLGRWKGILKLNNNLQSEVQFLIDKSQDGLATGIVEKSLTTGVGGHVLECANARVSLESRGNDKVLISFNGPKCEGSNVVSIEADKLNGRVKFGIGYRTLSFKKSS